MEPGAKHFSHAMIIYALLQICKMFRLNRNIELNPELSDWNVFFSFFPNIIIIADVIQSIAKRVDESAIFSICMTRDQMLARGMKQWQRQNKSSHKNPLGVSFIGENGIDSGALRKNFLTGMFSFFDLQNKCVSVLAHFCYIGHEDDCLFHILCWPICISLFWKEMLAGIERRFFEGGISGKVPKNSMTDFEKYNFK